jgi:hypothetical protein
MESEQPSCGDTIVPESGVIEVYVRELDQLFDSMDPSPFHERDLDRSAHEYIVSAAKELSAGGKMALRVYLAKPVGLPDEGKILGDGIRVYFARQAEFARRTLREKWRWGWINLMIGLTLLVLSVVVGEMVARRLGRGPLATVLRESLLIGGWVAMWRPMDFFLYEWWAMRAELRIFERLSDVAVRIVYTKESRPRTSNECVTICSGSEATLQPLKEM